MNKTKPSRGLIAKAAIASAKTRSARKPTSAKQEMRGAARAAEMTEEEVALEKLKDLAEKAAARKAATGQAGTVIDPRGDHRPNDLS